MCACARAQLESLRGVGMGEGIGLLLCTSCVYIGLTRRARARGLRRAYDTARGMARGSPKECGAAFARSRRYSL